MDTVNVEYVFSHTCFDTRGLTDLSFLFIMIAALPFNVFLYNTLYSLTVLLSTQKYCLMGTGEQRQTRQNAGGGNL